MSVLYKRNQIEDAIARLVGDASAQASTSLRTRMKRLFDTDRAYEVRPQSDKPESANYAFFSDSAPGKGSEVQFSQYEAYAVLVGLQMLNHNWPQKFVVESLRRLRRKLEQQHRRILRMDPTKLFDQDQIRLRARPGDPALVTASPVFLLIWSDQRTEADPAPHAEILNAEAAFARCLEKPGRSSTWLELTKSAHALAEQLSKSVPRRRGRS
jgi:hypothetical protein